VKALATNLDHPRWLYVLPSGDVLVAESNASPRPPKPDRESGWIQSLRCPLLEGKPAGHPSKY
jgi:hypothetical protein